MVSAVEQCSHFQAGQCPYLIDSTKHSDIELFM